MENALAELRDNAAGRLVIGANESTTLYLLPHIAALPAALPEGEGAGAAQPVEQDSGASCSTGTWSWASSATTRQDDRLASTVIYTDHLAFVVSPRHRFAGRESVSIRELGHGDLHRAQRHVAVPATWCCGSSSGTRCR